MGQLAFEGREPERPAHKVRTYAPASGELLAELSVTSDEEVRRVVGRARKAQAAWAVLPVEERAARLLRLRDAFAERAEDLVEVVSRECGKPRHEALVHEVTTLLDLVGWVCKHAPEALATERVPLHLMKHRSSEVHHVPRGVVGVVSPWNFPLIIPMGSVISALVAGNACVVKPSEVTPLVMLEAKKIYDSTGLPEDLFAVVVGYGATGAALIDAGIDYCVFTGAVETGRRAGSGSSRARWSWGARRRSSRARTATWRGRRARWSSGGSRTAARCASRWSACTPTNACTRRCSSGSARWWASFARGIRGRTTSTSGPSSSRSRSTSRAGTSTTP
jgi:acyl-CoA reductase-like NAD-dependent aldehyde dehydrogenase